MLVVGSMASDASRRELDLVLDGRAVTALAANLLVLAGQRIVSLRVVVEPPSRPLDRIVAGRAIWAVATAMNVLLLMARAANRVSIQEGRGRVALRTREAVVFPQ